MADSKVSDLTAATTIGGSDAFYLVQSGSSKKITASTIFNNITNATLRGNVKVESNVQLISSPTIIDTTIPITHLSADSVGGALAILPGETNQIKIITMISTTGGSYLISSNIANNANITFNSVGDTATLLYTSNTWFIIGGTASVT